MATNQEYGKTTAGSDVAADLSCRIKGKVVVITGVSPKSIGSKLAENIAKQEPLHLILASRTPGNLSTVASSLNSTCPGLKLNTVALDLSSQQSTRKAAEEIRDLVDHIDLLINNAAVVNSEPHYTSDGIELMFGVGHVGHFLFTSLLMPLFEAAAAKSVNGATRIINVSSEGHRAGPVRFSDYNFQGKEVSEDEQPAGGWNSMDGNRKFNVWASYGQVKTANILFSMGLNERFESKGIRSYAVHPGAVQTDLSRSLAPEDYQVLEKIMENSTWATTDQGTSCILVAALDPALDKQQSSASSVYLNNCQITQAAPWASDAKLADKLWELSERLTAVKS